MIELLHGDALSMLQSMPAGSVHTIVTSPPYWGLRDYGGDPADWPAVDYAPMAGLPALHVPAWLGQLGHEGTPAAFIGHLVTIFREARRVLRDDGTLWLNLGDSFAKDRGGSGGPSAKQTSNAGSRFDSVLLDPGVPEKNLIGAPWRAAFALQADGWHLRSDNIWAKPNPMPESVTDRPGKSHEYFFLLAKSERYYCDLDAVKVPSSGGASGAALSFCRDTKRAMVPGESRTDHRLDPPYVEYGTESRNLRSVWTVPPAGYSGAHFAVFPPDLIVPCILAGTSARGVCPACGAGYVRQAERSPMETKPSPSRDARSENGRLRTQTAGTMVKAPQTRTIGWSPGCDCDAGDPVPATVLDPFAGSGTTGSVAMEHGRRAVLIEQNAGYLPLIEERIQKTQPRLINF